MDKIKIAQVIGNARYGGVINCVLNFYRNIDRDKFVFHFYTFGPSPYDEDIERLGGKVIYVPNVLSVFKSVKDLKKHFAEENYYAVHSHMTTLNVVPLYAARRARVGRRISHAHSTTHKSEKVYIVKTVLKHFSKLFPTHLAGCSRKACVWLYGKRRGQEAFVLKNAIDTNRFAPITEEKAAKLKSECGIAGKKVIGSVGRFEYQKNQAFLVDAYARLAERRDDVVLVFAGGGRLRNELEAQIENLGLRDKVIIFDYQKQAEDYFGLFDLFVLPSRYEGLPLVAIEAQSMGLPCLLSDKITAETDVTGKVKFLPVDDEKLWADEMENMLDNCIRYDASESVAEHGYDITAEAKVLENYYLGLDDSKNG